MYGDTKEELVPMVTDMTGKHTRCSGCGIIMDHQEQHTRAECEEIMLTQSKEGAFED